MGWVVIQHAGRAEMLHDLQLWAIRYFCLDAAASLLAVMPGDELLAEIRDWFAAWEWIAPGVVAGVDFDRFARGSRQRADALGRVLERAAVRVRRFGSLVPLAYLAANINQPGAGYMKPQTSRRFVRAIARLSGLL